MSKEKKEAKQEAKQAGAAAGDAVINSGGTAEEAQQAAEAAEREALRDSGLFKNRRINELVDKWEDKSQEINQEVIGSDPGTMEYGSVGTETGYQVGRWRSTVTTYNNINTNTETMFAQGSVSVHSNNFGGGAVTNLKRTQDGIFAFRDYTSDVWEAYEYNNMTSVYSHDLRTKRTFSFTQQGTGSHYYVGAENQYFNPNDVIATDYTNRKIGIEIKGTVDKNGMLRASKVVDTEQKMDLADLKVGQLIESAFGTQMFNQNFVASDKGVSVKNNYVAPTKKSGTSVGSGKKSGSSSRGTGGQTSKPTNVGKKEDVKSDIKSTKTVQRMIGGKLRNVTLINYTDGSHTYVYDGFSSSSIKELEEKYSNFAGNLKNTIPTHVKLSDGTRIDLEYTLEYKNGKPYYIYGGNSYKSLDELKKDVKEELEFTKEVQSRGKSEDEKYKNGEIVIKDYNGYTIRKDDDGDGYRIGDQHFASLELAMAATTDPEHFNLGDKGKVKDKSKSKGKLKAKSVSTGPNKPMSSGTPKASTQSSKPSTSQSSLKARSVSTGPNKPKPVQTYNTVPKVGTGANGYTVFNSATGKWETYPTAEQADAALRGK